MSCCDDNETTLKSICFMNVIFSLLYQCVMSCLGMHTTLAGFFFYRSVTFSDIDECSAGTAICPLGQVCLNTEGSYRCQRAVDTSCPAGFTYNPVTRRCELNTSPQCPRGQMYNTVTRQCENSQNKQCPNGYALNVLNNQCEGTSFR